MTNAAEQLGRTALRLFARKGYTATSVSEIAEAAGVTKPMLYYYFGSKEQLARRLVVEPMEKLIEELETINTSEKSPFLRTVEWLAAQIAFCRADPDRARFVFALYFGPLGAELADAVANYGFQAKKIICHISVCREEFAGWTDDRLDDYVRALHGQMLSTVIEILYTEPLSSLCSAPDFELAHRLVTDLESGFIPDHQKTTSSG